MTLHLTWFQQHRIIQTSDRLLSNVRRGRVVGEYDPTANKTILVNTTDAMASLCYAQTAYIDGVPTDYVLASAFCEFEIGKGPSAPNLRYSPGTCGQFGYVGFPMLGPSFYRMLTQLDAVLPFDSRRSGELLLGLSLAGWKWPSRRARERHGYYLYPRLAVPFYWTVEWDFSGERRWQRQWIDRESVMPYPAIGQPGIELLANRLNAIQDPGQASAECLSDLLVELSEMTEGVGSDVSLLELPHPGAQTEGSYRYLGEIYPMEPISRSSLPYGSYSPWVLSPGLAMSPNLIHGVHHPLLVGYKIRLVGADSAITWGFGGQPRMLGP